MDAEAARREAESAKYRLRLMLQEIERAAKGDAALLGEVRRYERMLREIEVGEDEGTTRAAKDALRKLEPQILMLADNADVHFARGEGAPKWVRFLLWTFPLLLILVAIGVILERRRRKAVMDQASIAALDEGDRTS